MIAEILSFEVWEGVAGVASMRPRSDDRGNTLPRSNSWTVAFGFNEAAIR